MILCITEKPSVGRDIARILGANSRRDGYFEGPEYCVTWTFGHLCTLKEPHDYTPNWKRWALGTLPMIPPRFGIKLINDEGIRKQFAVIESLLKQCDEVINCGDAGQEGELIQRWVLQKAKCNKPVKRLWISSLTDEAIREGFNNLRNSKDFDPLYTAGLCRAIGDWVLGINATRLYTLKYASGSGNILSIGRVQTPTLALVVQRQNEIENFIPKTTFELKTTYKGTLFSCTGKSYETENEATAAIELFRNEIFKITDVSKKKGKEIPPRLFDLTSLQVECNKKYGLSAEATLKTIQSLYEKKVTTYPRVDTTFLTDDIYPKCGPILNSLTQYSNLLIPLRGSKLRKSKKVFDNSKVTDHHAIIPTGQSLPPLSDTETKVFDTIARRFISVFYPDCSFEQTAVKGEAGKFSFKATGKVIIDAGWREVYAREKKSEENSDEKNTILPLFTVGESGPHIPKVTTKTTQPPHLYTEGTLLKAMETAGATVDDDELRDALKANGIGRPSTRAAIIEILYKRGYICRERKSIKATDAGINLISMIRQELLKSAKLTGIWEGKLRLIEKQQFEATEFIQSLKQMVQDVTISVLSDNSNQKIEASSISEVKENKKNKRTKKSSTKEDSDKKNEQ